MDALLERWCECHPWGRVLFWCLGSLLAGLAACGTLLRPVDRQCAELERQLMENVRANAALWPAVRQMPFRSETAVARVRMPFSPLDFQGDDAALVHWKPLQNGGELMLDLEWKALPALFSRLAQRDVQIVAFTIAPQGTALRLRLELEHAK